MRGDFVIKFLSAVVTTAGDIGSSWSRIPYKGFRYSNFDIYGSKTKRRYDGFKNLEYRGLIKNKGNDKFIFTKNGQEWLGTSLKRYFKYKNGGKWDKKWRIVIFDIPQEMHGERGKFRRKLKSLGLVMLQRSVFIFPYSCEEEIGDIASNLGVNEYIDIIIAESVGSREEELMNIFKLK